jgi:probable rRNA maturation factor
MAVFLADEQHLVVDLERLQRLATYVLERQRVPDAMELSVLCIDAGAMRKLNAHHMGADRPTDVLAFPMDMPGETLPGQPAILGDVVLCPEVAAAQAAERGSSPDAEMQLLLVHGILHLLGHDHAEGDERRAMFGLTQELLAGFRSRVPDGGRDGEAS